MNQSISLQHDEENWNNSRNQHKRQEPRDNHFDTSVEYDAYREPIERDSYDETKPQNLGKGSHNRTIKYHPGSGGGGLNNDHNSGSNRYDGHSNRHNDLRDHNRHDSGPCRYDSNHVNNDHKGGKRVNYDNDDNSYRKGEDDVINSPPPPAYGSMAPLINYITESDDSDGFHGVNDECNQEWSEEFNRKEEQKNSGKNNYNSGKNSGEQIGGKCNGKFGEGKNYVMGGKPEPPSDLGSNLDAGNNFPYDFIYKYILG